MIATPAIVDVPLRTDENGVIRIGQTRVTLLTIIGRYQIGGSPEAIHEGFPSVSLSDIYAVIAYYLAQRAQVDQYIAEAVTEAERWRRDYEANNPEVAASNAKLRALLDKHRHESSA